MKKGFYILLLLAASIACEEVYRPDIDEVDDMLVVEATLVANQQINNILIYRSHGFNSENKTFPPVAGARVYLVDDESNSVLCPETAPGIYQLGQLLDNERSYRLFIELNGEIYESGVQTVPSLPKLDTVYADFETRIRAKGDADSKDDLLKEEGAQILADIEAESAGEHFRFFGKRLIQYQDSYDTVIDGFEETKPIYIWRSTSPFGTFNIAGPAEYSTSKNISKHPLEFFDLDYHKFMPDTMAFFGWIYFIYQYGLNADTYDYYKDLNQQLNAEGKIFDPVYVQPEGNIKCTSDPEQIVLGNFEIATFTEHRYFLFYYNRDRAIFLRRIPYFYDIPDRGYVKDIMPEFWETFDKNYPDE